MPSPPTDPTDDLQFQTVEPANAATPAAPARNCVVCKRPIQSVYFAVRDKILCPDCAARIRTGPQGNELGRLVRAFGFGLGPALLGAVVWGVILFYFHYQIGLIAVALGFMIGKAVRKGSGGRGGPAYQVMAVLMAYSSVALAHFLDFYGYVSDGFRSVIPLDEVVRLIQLAFQFPITSGMKNPIGLLILGFALWEAWKFTKYYPIPITGPYELATKTPPAPAANPDPGVII